MKGVAVDHWLQTRLNSQLMSTKKDSFCHLWQGRIPWTLYPEPGFAQGRVAPREECPASADVLYTNFATIKAAGGLAAISAYVGSLFSSDREADRISSTKSKGGGSSAVRN
jgi:hypothetical protein